MTSVARATALETDAGVQAEAAVDADTNVPTGDDIKAAVDAQAAAVYALHDLRSPTLSGLPLRLVTALLESPLLGRPLRNSILVSSGFHAFRERARHASEDVAVEPMVLPLHPPPVHSREGGEEPSLAAIDRLHEKLGARIGGKRATVDDYRAAYETGRVTPSDVVRALLPLIAASNEGAHGLNAVIDVVAADAVAQADASTRRWREGGVLSVLDGVPYVVKVSVDAAGYSTGCGSSFLKGEQGPSTQDADVVRAMREAGAVLVGKGAMDELGIGVRGYSMFSGQTRNPHGEQYVSGGSSGGCAAAVAAGLCPVAIGSDSGGSIRIPAACCGVFGLKPTFARVSVWGSVLTERDEKVDDVSPVMHLGPIAGCAKDLTAVYYVLAGFASHRSIKEHEEYAAPVEVAPKELEGVQGLRVGVCAPWVRDAGPGGLRAMERFLEAVRAAGAVEVPIVVPDLEDLRVGMAVSIVKKRIAGLKAKGYYDERDTSNFGLDVRGKLRMGAEFEDADVGRARVVRAKAIKYCTGTLFGEGGVDVIVTPALGTDTPLVPGNLKTGLADVQTDSAMMRFTIFANMTGLPACVMPAGRGDNGMPVAVQAIAAPWNEKRLLEVCMWAEEKLVGVVDMMPKHCFNALDHAGGGEDDVGKAMSEM